VTDVIEEQPTLELQIERLKASVSYWEDRYNQEAARHRADIAIIGERLIFEADQRGWCEQYDKVIEDLNAKLHVELPARAREYEVSVSFLVHMNVTVTADSPEEAQSEANAMIEYELGRLDYCFDFDCQDNWEFDEP